MKLEHAKHYLGTGLKLQEVSKGILRSEPPIMTEIIELSIHNIEFSILGNYGMGVKSIKPILYPLDLTKPIWFEGKEIVPFEEIFGFKYTKEVTIHYEFYKGMLDDIWLSAENGSEIDVDITFCFTEYLNMYKWRLDVNRLIPKDRAISVHDVDSEIYKKN
jgi:hypothetical protein